MINFHPTDISEYWEFFPGTGLQPIF